MASGFPRCRISVLILVIAALCMLMYYMFSRHQPLSGRLLHSPANADVLSLENLERKVRILCFIPTSTRNLATKATAVRDTWGRRCDKTVFFSDKTDLKFPTTSLNIGHEGLDMLLTKVRAAFTYIHDRHLLDADWFLKADDDTYVIVENLRYLLSHYDPEKPLYFGHHFQKFSKQGYMSGGAGYVLSREALRRLVRNGFRQGAARCRRWGGAEDAALGKCLEAVGVRPGVSLDVHSRQTFHPFNLLTHLSGTYPRWYYEYSKYQVKQGATCCSDFSISFHFVEPNVMRMMDHLLYNIQVYGIQQGDPPRNSVFRTLSGKLANHSIYH